MIEVKRLQDCVHSSVISDVTNSGLVTLTEVFRAFSSVIRQMPG